MTESENASSSAGVIAGKENSVLRPTGTFVLLAISGNTEVLAAGNDIFFSENFEDWIANDLEVVSGLPSLGLARFELVELAMDITIDKALPEGYVFENRHEFCAYLKRLLEDQAGGKEGVLLNDGHANCFRVRGKSVGVVVVVVHWDSDDCKWNCDSGQYSLLPWRAGQQVLCPTASSVVG